MRLIAAAALAALVITGAAEARTWRIRPGADAEQQLQAALIEARAGDTVSLARGRFELTAGLSLDVDRVTIRGEGADESIISFNGQRRGAEGLLITSDGVSLRDFAVENARGDAIKARDCNGITIRGVRVEWTRGPHPQNGAYGLYPVNCDNVLIERSVATRRSWRQASCLHSKVVSALLTSSRSFSSTSPRAPSSSRDSRTMLRMKLGILGSSPAR